MISIRMVIKGEYGVPKMVNTTIKKRNKLFISLFPVSEVDEGYNFIINFFRHFFEKLFN